MFRANRIGTPWIAQNNLTSVTGAVTFNGDPLGDDLWRFSALNVVPAGDFGQVHVRYNGAATAVAASVRVCWAHLFSVEEPLNGDAVGVELMSSIWLPAATSVSLLPFLVKCDTLPTTIFDTVETQDNPVFLDSPYQPFLGGSTTLVARGQYKTQAVVQGSPVAGVWAHGWAAWGTAVWNPNTFRVNAAVRQLNDQTNVGYRDTRR